ncbi:MAG TPA: hypothetical protein VG389_20100 [Myxococcota bacterium]|jgi:hypothetical protein|nr:hypothetical protein [Myxococcota bacterium]
MKRRYLAPMLGVGALLGASLVSATALADDGFVTHTPSPVLVNVGVGWMPTSLCGRLAPGDDCFYGVIGDLNLKLIEAPRTLTFMLDLSGVLYRDWIETGGLAGGGVRLRFDKWTRFVPYGVAVLYAGFGAYQGGGGAARLSSRLAVGGEISLRDGVGGRGVGLFLELGSGAGCCTTLTEGSRLAYNQFFLTTGLSFP